MTADGAGRPRPLLLLAVLILGTALLRLALAARLPLADDEAFYWLWSRHLAWGYPEHPPGIAGLIALSTALGGDSPPAIRAVPVLLASGLPWLVFAAGRDLFDARAGARAAVIASVLPIAALGTALAFPDTALGSLWILILWTGWRALQDGRGWWIAVGAALGLGLLAKLTAVFAVLGIVIVLVTGRRRRALRDPWFYAGAALTAALVAPFILWNATNGWWTFRSLVDRELWVGGLSVPENLLLFAAGQLLYHGPAAIVLLVAVLAAARRPAPAWRYLVWMSAPLLLAAAVNAATGRAKPHWPSPAYLVAAVTLGALWPEWPQRLRKLTWATLSLTVLVTATVAAAALLPIGLDLQAAFGRWGEVAHRADDLAAARRARGRPVFILTDGYQAASQIAYLLREGVVVTPLRYAFNIWRPPATIQGSDAVYVDIDGRWREQLPRHCAQVRKEETLPVAPGRDATLYLCISFRGTAPER